MKVEGLSWPKWLIIYRDGLPVRIARQSPIQVVANW